jgi:hypothetical protein
MYRKAAVTFPFHNSDGALNKLKFIIPTAFYHQNKSKAYVFSQSRAFRLTSLVSFSALRLAFHIKYFFICFSLLECE